MEFPAYSVCLFLRILSADYTRVYPGSLLIKYHIHVIYNSHTMGLLDVWDLYIEGSYTYMYVFSRVQPEGIHIIAQRVQNHTS